MENKKKKEIVIDLSGIDHLYPFYRLLIQKLELPEFTGMYSDAMYDFMAEPWEEDRNVRFIGLSKTSDDVRTELRKITDMFAYVKEFQAKCGNEFAWNEEA